MLHKRRTTKETDSAAEKKTESYGERGEARDLEGRLRMLGRTLEKKRFSSWEREGGCSVQQSDEPYREADLLARRGQDLRRRRQVLSSPQSFHRRRNEEKRVYYAHAEDEKGGGENQGGLTRWRGETVRLMGFFELAPKKYLNCIQNNSICVELKYVPSNLNL